MWGLFTAFAAVIGLVTVAYREKADPILKPAWQQARLSMLAGIPVGRLTLDQAEDGVVLARKFEEKTLEQRFAMVAQQLKKGKR